MSNYLKPQSPIYNESTDSYIYPLTTSDQIIMPDGSRLGEVPACMQMELLWENASPESEFGSQTIALDLQNYDGVYIHVQQYVGGATMFYMAAIGKMTLMSCSNKNIGERAADVQESQIVFSDGFLQASYGVQTANNKWMVPYQIYGIKGGKLI